MGNIGDPLSLPNPAVGTAGTTYASQVQALLAELANRVAVRVPLASIATGDPGQGEMLDLGNCGLMNAQYLHMYSQASAPSGAPFGRLASYAGDLYYIDASGAVRITAGATLNAASLSGFTGDYGLGPEAAEYTALSETYTFWSDQAGGGYGIVTAREFDAVDEASGFVIKLEPSGAIAADYTIQLPPALPAGGEVSLLAIDGGGGMNMADLLSPITKQFSVNGGVKHDDETQWYPAMHFTAGAISGSPTIGGFFVTGSGPYSVGFLLPAPPVGRRFKGVSVRHYKAGTGTTTCTVQLQTVGENVGTGAPTYTNVGTPGTGTLSAAFETVTATATETATSPVYYRVLVTFTTTGVISADNIVGIGLIHDYV
jgi:hypothetical protein